jgi:multidrug efflux pump subunit AcrA (membrane-fusion protein)
MYVNVELVTYVNPDAVLVPKQAIVYDADQTFVFRLIPGLEPPDRKVERVLLVPKLQDRLFVEPLSGIEVGDRLVIAGKTGLKDQGLVRLPGDPKPETEKDPETPEE